MPNSSTGLERPLLSALSILYRLKCSELVCRKIPSLFWARGWEFPHRVSIFSHFSSCWLHLCPASYRHFWVKAYLRVWSDNVSVRNVQGFTFKEICMKPVSEFVVELEDGEAQGARWFILHLWLDYIWLRKDNTFLI